MSYESGSNNNGRIFIIFIVIAAFIYINSGEVIPRSSSINDIPYNEDNQTFSRGNDIIENLESQDINSNNDIILNACGYENYGFPDYIGTFKEGWDCSDAIESESNMECLTSPPMNYDGIIDLGSPDQLSDPSLTCCRLDGTCNW